MKTKEIEALESYFKTENEHWNKHAFEMLNEIIEENNFDNPKIPMQLLSDAISIFTEQYETPLIAVQNFSKETDKHKLTPNQKLFVNEKVLNYLKYSDFEKANMNEINDILKSKTEHLKNDIKQQKPEYNKPLVGSIRDILKEQMQKELEQLPETLKNLEPVQRLNILCKLIPYVLPKVEAVHSEKGEPEHDKKASFSDFNWE